MDGKLFARKYYRNIQAAGHTGHQEYGRGAVLAVMVGNGLETLRYLTTEDVASLASMPDGYLDTLTMAIATYDPKAQTVLLYIQKQGEQVNFFATVLKDERTTPERAHDEVKHLAEKLAGMGRSIGSGRKIQNKR